MSSQKTSDGFHQAWLAATMKKSIDSESYATIGDIFSAAVAKIKDSSHGRQKTVSRRKARSNGVEFLAAAKP
jgi:hypothetical protein